jgi:4-amino-4-deoxy-L-arabinose transferase
VAKNLIDQPLVPRLYADPALPYDYRDWTGNHVWLHKPPLSLWMQAASMKMFGVAEIPMRLPSIVFSTIAVLVTFGIGRVLFSPGVGLVAACFHAFNGLAVDLAAGRRTSDHVDTLLILIVEAGILAALVTRRRHPTVAGAAVGLACGLACLTKSLPGLLVLPLWIVVQWQYGRTRVLREVLVAACVALLVAAPWAIYCSVAFPQEWAHESTYAWRHVTEVLENQGGPPWAYVADLPRFFGELVYVPLAMAIASLFKGDAGPARRAMLLWMAVPYALFSLMATKMPAYVMLAAPALFLIQADVWLNLNNRRATETGWRRALLTAALFVLALLPARHLLSPSGPLEDRERHPEWVQDLRALNSTIGVERAVVFNLQTPIEAMFYTPYVAYAHVPTDDEVRSLQGKGYRIYVYQPRTNDHPPSVRRIGSTASGARPLSFLSPGV